MRAPTFVLDATFAVPWVVQPLATTYTDDVLVRLVAGAAVVPSGWPAELTAALLSAERRGVCARADTDRVLSWLFGFAIEYDPPWPPATWTAVVGQARTSRWDTATTTYVELARRRSLPLATISPRLRRAATAAGVPIFAP
jgi:predicted nucleic acid-binding protein